MQFMSLLGNVVPYPLKLLCITTYSPVSVIWLTFTYVPKDSLYLTVGVIHDVYDVVYSDVT